MNYFLYSSDYFSCLSFIDTSDLFYKKFPYFPANRQKNTKRKNKVDTSKLMTKFLEMEEKAERQFWEFEEKRMKLEQEQEERWRRDESEGEERQRRENRPFMANMMTL